MSTISNVVERAKKAQAATFITANTSAHLLRQSQLI